ncbi:MAG: hypothetical protein ACR2PF_06580 [Rhizobiaceae bacterium]
MAAAAPQVAMAVAPIVAISLALLREVLVRVHGHTPGLCRIGFNSIDCIGKAAVARAKFQRIPDLFKRRVDDGEV